MKQGIQMKQKLLYAAVSLIFTTNVFAQSAADQAASINEAPNTTINYNANAANLNGEKVAVPMIEQNNGLNSPNGPTNPPSGLPQDVGSVQVNSQARRSSADSFDAIQSTINILNTPDQKIRDLRNDIYNKGKVISEVPEVAPKVSNDVIVARLEPGSVSPVIRLGKNRTTTITMTDMSGQPWPIINYDGLSEDDFTVKRLDNPAPEGYVLSITPKGGFVSGNLVLVLKGLPTPISIDFISNQKTIDGSKQVRVMGRGPNTQLSSISLPDGLDSSLLSILQGVSPDGATMLKTSTAAVQAWKSRDGSMYVRTRYKVMSPAFEHVTSSPDGTYAYKMVPVSIVLYKADEGRFGEFRVEGF